MLKDAATLEAFFNQYVPPSEIRTTFETLLIHLEKKIKTYQVLQIDGENYLDTYAGKVEAEYMKEYFKNVRIQAKRYYENEYNKIEEDSSKC